MRAATGGASGVGGGAGAASGLVVLFDCSTISGVAPSRSLAADLAAAVQIQLAEQLQVAAAAQASLIEAAARSALLRHPGLGEALATVVASLGSRAGLPGTVAQGSELPRCREAAIRLRGDPLGLLVLASEELAAGGAQQLLVRPPTALHAALALLREAVTHTSGASGARASASRAASGQASVSLAAARGMAEASGRSVVVALLRAEALTRAQSGSVAAGLLEALEVEAAVGSPGVPAGAGAASPGTLRLLLQTCDGVAAARAREAARAEVLSVDEWPEEMARAIFVPRFLAAADEAAWRAVWRAVGGHAAHLRHVAELLGDERQLLAMQRAEVELERRREEVLTGIRPEGSSDAMAKAAEAQRQHEEDSWRADARGRPLKAEESLAQRLVPELLEGELGEFETQVTAFARHPLVTDWGAGLGGAGRAAARLQAALQPLCAAGPEGVDAPPGGLGSLSDPILLALLDVGLLVPKWTGGPATGERLALANQLARALLLSWAEAQQAALPWQERLVCSWSLWRASAASHP